MAQPTDFIEIVGAGDAATTEDGTAVRFILESNGKGAVPLACTTAGLDTLVSMLEALSQNAKEKQRAAGGNGTQNTVHVTNLGVVPNETGSGIILQLEMASGIKLNIDLDPQLAKDTAEQMSQIASDQLSRQH